MVKAEEFVFLKRIKRIKRKDAYLTQQVGNVQK